jgi:uncharacterized membrane protein YedE/YeeE
VGGRRDTGEAAEARHATYTEAMADLTLVPALLGGSLIGLAAAWLLADHERVAGISGIAGGLVKPEGGDARWRLAFLGGLVAAGMAAAEIAPAAFATSYRPGIPVLVAAGLLVGFGTRLGGGCTSGHGVCGIGRGSLRSVVGTMTFMATGFATVALLRALGALS